MVAPKGRRGPRGLKGQRGPTGHRGTTGARGPAGHSPSRDEILRAVQEEFDLIRTELHVQLERMGQIQRQVDSVERLLQKALSDALTESD